MAIVLMSALLACAATRQSDRFEQHLARAERLLDEGAVAEAVEPLSEAHRLRPDSREVLWMLAVAHRELGNFDEGIPYAEAFVEAVPANVGGHLMLASYYGDGSGDEDEALEQYRVALSIEPGNPRALHGLAMIEMRRGRDARATAALERIVSVYPSDPRALVPLGVLYSRHERSRDAMEVLSRAVREAPDSHDAQHYLGVLYSNLGRHEAAVRHLERALKLQPDDPATLYEIGLVHARLEELSEAQGYFERALEGRPERAETHFRLAEIHHYESDVDEAERYYLRAIELDSGYAAAYFHLGRLYEGASRAREAEAPLLRALELDPSLAEAHHELARIYDGLDQPDKAHEHFDKAVELAPFAPEPRLNFGNFLLRTNVPAEGRAQLLEFRQLKQTDDRIQELKAAVNFDPTNASSKRDLVEYLLEHQRSDEALEESLRLLALATMEPIHHVLVARVLEARGERAEALTVLENALEELAGAPEIERQLERLRRLKP